MLGWLNLLFSLCFPSLVEWWIRWNAVEPAKSFDGVDLAKALAALAGILILGLGGILIIGLSGRSFRRLYFSKTSAVSRTDSSPAGHTERDWARPPRNPEDPD